jgi:hypothetical protein
LRHPPGAIALRFLKQQKLTISILRVSDVVPAQALPLPKAGGDQNVSQPMASREHKVTPHRKVTFQVAKRFMAAIVLTKPPWGIISDEKYSMVNEVGTSRLNPRIVSWHLEDLLLGCHLCVNWPVVHLIKLIRKPETLYVFILVSTPQLEL